MVRKETVGNIIATVVIAALLSWAVFRGETQIAAFAPVPGGIFGILPGTFNFTLLVTIALTLITRRRVRAGLYRRLEPCEGLQIGAALPRSVLLRALMLAAIATIIYVPVGAGVSWAGIRVGLIPGAWSFAGMLFFFVLYFAALAVVLTPVVLWRALRD